MLCLKTAIRDFSKWWQRSRGLNRRSALPLSCSHPYEEVIIASGVVSAREVTLGLKAMAALGVQRSCCCSIGCRISPGMSPSAVLILDIFLWLSLTPCSLLDVVHWSVWLKLTYACFSRDPSSSLVCLYPVFWPLACSDYTSVFRSFKSFNICWLKCLHLSSFLCFLVALFAISVTTAIQSRSEK